MRRIRGGAINSSVTGIFDKRAFSLRLNKSKEILSPHLDDRGWNCPCFLVDSVKKSFDEMRKNDDVFCSIVDDVVINNRKLEVGFIKSNAINIIFELISPGK